MMKRVLLAALAFVMLGAATPASPAQDVPAAGGPSAGREVKVYLVALDDNGKRGRRIGCNDSLVPVTRTVAATGAPLKAAVEELLAVPREYEGGLGNYWAGEDLRVQSAVIGGGMAT